MSDSSNFEPLPDVKNEEIADPTAIRSLIEIDWRQFFTRLYDKIFETDIFNRAAQTAFYFSFAIFPLLYFLISVFGLIVGTADRLKGQIFEYLQRIMPGVAFVLVQHTVEEIIANSTRGKLTIGLVITLWAASAGVDGIRSALNAVYQLPETRSWWRTKFESLLLTLVVTILSATVLSIVFYGWQLIQLVTEWIGMPIKSAAVLVSIQWISIIVLMLFVCELIFNLLPNFRKLSWTWVTPGSIVAIIAWLLLTGGFRTYISYFSNYDRAYGSLGAVIILMSWLYLTALVVMLGGAINSVYSDMAEKISEDQRCDKESVLELANGGKGKKNGY